MTVATIPADQCPECAGPFAETVWLQPALVRHGGHGATVRTAARACAECGWALQHTTGEERP